MVDNVVSILSGFSIAFFGSLVQPNHDFHWEMLNDEVPLKDDIEPPKACSNGL